jgi:uncharacterized membrane protein YqaE (UPF0057 family)
MAKKSVASEEIISQTTPTFTDRREVLIRSARSPCQWLQAGAVREQPDSGFTGGGLVIFIVGLLFSIFLPIVGVHVGGGEWGDPIVSFCFSYGIGLLYSLWKTWDERSRDDRKAQLYLGLGFCLLPFALIG